MTANPDVDANPDADAGANPDADTAASTAVTPAARTDATAGQPASQKPLYILPFDHRQSYVTGMFHYDPPLSDAQRADVADSKRLVYEGYLQALADGVPADCTGILVDEEFGTAVLDDALAHGHITALSTEKSGTDEFDFEYGDAWSEHIARFAPTYVKVLVRYNPDGDAALNARQSARLAMLSDWCSRQAQRFMFELLVPATAPQLATLAGDKRAYDLQLRPRLMLQAMRELQDAGVAPNVWKLEGLDDRDDCIAVVDTARRHGQSDVGCIVLGRNAPDAQVQRWLETAASVPGYTGFAVGRTTFWDAVAGARAGSMARADAAALIARRLKGWVEVFERARST